jgi:hypothetical protein
MRPASLDWLPHSFQSPGPYTTFLLARVASKQLLVTSKPAGPVTVCEHLDRVLPPDAL